jgi:hypothetical protein
VQIGSKKLQASVKEKHQPRKNTTSVDRDAWMQSFHRCEINTVRYSNKRKQREASNVLLIKSNDRKFSRAQTNPDGKEIRQLGIHRRS